MSLRTTAAALGIVLTAGLAAAPRASAAPQHYPVKFVCDTFHSGDLGALVAIKGDYRTAINVFNPGTKTVSILRTFSRSALTTGGNDTNSDAVTLGPMTSTVIDCSTIASAVWGTPFGQLPGVGFEGFVTLSTTADLDVSAVYTAGSQETGVTSMQVLPIEPKPGALKVITITPRR
jgi:hypothetical protein